MSAVHDEIAMQALSVQHKEIKELFKPYIEEYKASSWYPDVFADTSMSQKKKDAIDSDADRFIYPEPPDNDLQRKLDAIAGRNHSYTLVSPFSQIYLIRYYLRNAVESLKSGDVESAAKFCGVYSHVIADVCEPIHAIKPAIADVVVPPPKEFTGFELHAGVEGLKAPVKIRGYKPKMLGASIEQAELGACAGLIEAHYFGAGKAIPIVQALYAKDTEKATELSGLAQSESARHFADFIFTVFSLAKGCISSEAYTCDLRKIPYISNSVDMLYRYQPIKDASLVPYSGGKMKPLALRNKDGITAVNGLGVVPLLAPPFNNNEVSRIADIEYLVVPGAYRQFRAVVGLNPLFSESMPTAKFQVSGDGKVLAETGVVKPGDTCENLVAELGNTEILTLRMLYVDTPDFERLNRVSGHLAWVSHGVWGWPELV